MQVHQPDRGTRVEQKLLHLLANVQADGSNPLAEVLSATLPQLRRGMTLCIVTGSTDRDLGARACRRSGAAGSRRWSSLLDRASYIGVEPDEHARAELAAVRHALAEYDIEHRLVRRGDDLAEAHRRRGSDVPCLTCASGCLYPRAGWLSLGLLLVMALTLALGGAGRRVAGAAGVPCRRSPSGRS